MKMKKKAVERKQTESNENTLSRKQIEAIPYLVACRSLEDGCRRAKLSKSTLYSWLKNDNFRIELSTAREKVIGEALERLKTSVTGAIDGLLSFLDSKEDWLKMQACREIINHFFKVTEVEDLKKRIEALEEKISK